MRARYKLIGVAACALLGLLAALLIPGTRDARRGQPAAEPAASRADSAPPRMTAVQHASVQGASALANTAAAAHDRHPHPITAEHRKLYRDADLIDGAASLLRKNAVAEARALLARHRSEYGQRVGSDNEGLVLLADCIERNDAASVERARRFYDRNTASMVRRQIRKQCLE